MNHLEDPLVLYGETFASRLLLGTSRYPSPHFKLKLFYQ